MQLSPDAEPFSAPGRPDEHGRRVGVLVSHGFTGVPASMRPWAEHLADHGYAVELPRLPGHGTRWQDLNRTTWADWYAEIAGAFDRLRAGCDAVGVGGLSLGGALVLRLAADRGEQVAGVVVVNPAVDTRRRDVKALPVLKHLVPAFPAIAGDIKKPGVTEHGYTRTPLRAAHSMMRAWPPLRADLHRITAPVLYFRSTVDHVVDDSSQQAVLAALPATQVTLRPLTDSYHVATLDNDAPAIFTESTEFFDQVTAAPAAAPPTGAEGVSS